MNDRPEGNGHENMCDERLQNDLLNPADVHAKAKNTGPKQKIKRDQDQSPITKNNHSKPIEEAGMSQSRRYTWRAQPQRHALRHLTIINMFFFKTYFCTI